MCNKWSLIPRLLGPHLPLPAAARLPSNPCGLRQSPWGERSLHLGFTPLELSKGGRNDCLALGKGLLAKGPVLLNSWVWASLVCGYLKNK